MRGFGDYADDDTASAIKARDYKDATDLVSENHARPVGKVVLGSEIIGSLNAVDYKWPQNQQLDENKFIVVDEKPILIDRGAFNQGQNALYKPIISDDPVIPSLVARGPHAVAIPIHDQATRHSGKRGTKSDGKGNGFGVGNEGDPMNTLTSGDRHAVAYTMRMREGKPGGGKGPLISEEKSLTLGAATNDQTIFQPNPLLSFDTQFGSNANVFENQSPTLKASQAAPSVMQYDGYNQRIHEDDVSVTLRLDRDSSDFVAQPITFDGFNQTVNDVSQTIRADKSDGDHVGMIQQHPTMSVRRLTPLECERLMGWPDRWTETKADGTPQADTHRYKQCGNGVASPVAQWIGQQLLQLDKEHHAPPTTTTT